MIIDAYLYAGEWEMADLRTRTLAPANVVPVAVSCDLTYQGDPVGVMAAPPRSLWMTVHATPNPDGSRGFYVEHQHRSGLITAVRAAVPALEPDDVLMVSDVDEIPDPDTLPEIEALCRSGSPVSLSMRMHGFALDYLLPRRWYGTTAAQALTADPVGQRNVQAPTGTVVESGWHLSWMGTPEQRARKLATFSHIELADLDTERCYREAEHANGEPLIRLTDDDAALLSWPQPILDGSWVPPEHWRAP